MSLTHVDIEILEAVYQERRAVIAYLLDRAAQLDEDTLFDELITDLVRQRHIECYEAGEYDGLRQQLDVLLRGYGGPR